MKNFAYRHYFSRASGFSKVTKRAYCWFDPAAFARKGVASLLSGLLVLQPVLLQAQQLTPDVNAPIGNQPGIGIARNEDKNIPLVDIVTPNGQGLSHNKYHDFNVGNQGLILNNLNAENDLSKLGARTPGNPNLRNSGPASVILNEVTSGNRSALQGATEVFGGRADVIIANPNGITCDGCGFINTPRATLTTGTPDIDGAGKLSGFTVQGGDVTFGSKGGNFASGDGAVDLFDIVSRRIEIDGRVDGKHLRLSAGRQKFDYATGEVTALSGADDAGEFAIDGSALGSMYADRIKIVVTDKGAGVRMRNDMAANAGELKLTADGKISLGNASGRDGVSIQSKSRQVEAQTITSKKKVVVKAAKGITLEAVAADGDVILSNGGGLLSVEGDVTSLGNIELTSSGAITTGNVVAGKNASLQAGQGIAAGEINAVGAASLTTASGNIALSGTAKAGGGTLNMTATSGAITAASLVSFNNMTLTAGADMTTGDILSGGALVAAARSLKAGTLLSAQALTVNTGSFNATNVTSNSSVNITGATTISGQLLAGSDLTVTGSAINIARAVAGVDLIALANGTIATSGIAHDLNLTATAGDLIVNRLLSSGNTVASATGNLSANVVSRGDLNLTAGGAVTLSGQSRVGGNATVNGASLNIGTLVSGVDFAATEQSGGSLILKTGAASATGATSATGVTSLGQMTLGATNGSITADQLLSGGDLKAKAQQSISYSSLQSFASADLNAVLGSISLDKNTVAKGNIALTLQSLDLSNNRSKLATAGNLIVNADNANLANSTLTFGGIVLNLSGSADASNTKLRAVTANGGSGDITINAQTVVTTSATALLAAHDLTLTLASLTNAGQLAANNNLSIKINNDLTNTSTGLIYAGNNGQLFVNGTISNNFGAILSGNDLTFANYVGTGKNAALINTAGLIQAGRNLSIQTEYLKNEANGEPTFGERQEDGPRYSFGTPDKYDELFDNDTLMRGRLFYDAREGVKWGRGGCRYKDGDPCDVTWLDKGLWNTKEETYGYLTLPDGSIYKAFTWNEVGSNDGKGKIWYDWNDAAAMSAQYQSQYFISKPTIQGLIQANGDVTIDATKIDNFYSSIEAGGNAQITSNHLTNKGVTLYRNVYMTCLADKQTCYGYNSDGTRNSAADISANSSVLVGREAVDSLSSVIRARGALVLNVGTIDNTAADGSIAGYAHYEAASTTGDPLSALNGITAGGALFTPNAVLDALLVGHGISLSQDEIAAALGNSAPKPDSGGFGGTVPGQNFIYETRAEFLDVSKFYGSGYYLNRIGYKPDHQILFLGDAYFENQLIDSQMRQATGRGLGSGTSDAVDQMKSLFDNGIAYAQSQSLVFGEPLSAEQLAALDSSIVIYVKQNMNGVEVFAPVLYVAAKEREAIVSAGAMIEGNSVVIAGDAVSNSGLIASNTDLRVESTTISATGGGFAATGNLTLAARDGITLSAGTTTFNGQTVVVPTDAVAAGGNAILQSGTDVNLNGVNVKAGEGLAISGENVNIGVARGISVDGSESVTGSKLATGNDLAIKATNDVTVSGSQIKAGDNLAIVSETGNLTIQSAIANRKDGFGETTTQQKSDIASGGSTSLNADKNVVIAGSDVSAGGNLAVQAGESVAVIATQDHASGSFGSNSFDTTTQQGSNLSSGGDTSVNAGTDILIGASNLDAGGNVDLAAKGDVNIIAMADRSEEHTSGKIYQRNETGTNAVGSSIAAGGNVKADAGNDLNIIGSDISANGSVGLKAENNVNVLAAESEYHLDSKFKESGGTFGKTRAWTKNEDSTTLTGSSINGGTGVDISSGNDTTVAASKVQAGDKDHKADLNINAGGDLIIASGKDTVDQDSSKSTSGFLSKKSGTNQNYDETTVASELGASGNVNLNAGDNVAISGSKVTAGENIAIEGESVSIIGAQEKHDAASSSKKSGFGVGSGDGFYSIYGSEKKSSSENIVANVGSELSAGNDVSIKARETDVNVVGSKVEAGNDIALDAARDVNILPGAESYASEDKEKRSGFGVQVKSGNGSASIGIGYGSSKDETKQGAETNATSSLSAGRDVVITAGRDANLQAAWVEAENDVAITAERDVNLLAAQDKTNYEHMHEELFAGITASVSTGLVSSAKSIADAAGKVANVSDGYSAANAGFAGLKAYDAIKNLQGMANGTGNIASASIGVGFEYSKSKENAESSVPVVTGIRGGNSVSIEAKSGDINSHGAQIIAGYDENGLLSGGAGDINLKAGNDINLESAQATNNSSSSSKSAGASIGYSVGVGLGGATGGWTGSANASSGKSNSNSTMQVNTHVTGSGNVNIESGRDTNLKGAVVEGEMITANVGRDLNIISVPDTGESSNKSSSFGVSGSLSGGTPKVTGVSPGYGTGFGETNWVSEQSGLVSKGEMDVRVEGNTHLGAGKIVSESGDLKLDTGTLTHEDFSGAKKYEGFDIQANIDLTPKDADGNKQQQPDQTSQPKTTAEGTYQLDDTRQEVRATVGPGEIIIRDKDKQAELEAGGQTEDFAALNRDPDKAYEITKDKHVEIDYYLSDTSVKQAFQAGKTIAETFGSVLDQMVKDGKRTPEQAALSKEMFPFLDDPNVRAALAQCAQQHGAVDFSIFSWIAPSAHAQTGCPIPVNGQIKYFSPSQAGTCLADYDQLTGVVRGVIGATGTTIAGLAGAFLLASTTAAGTDINQKFTAGDGSTVLITGKGDQPFWQFLVTYPDGTTANLTIETYDDGGTVRLTSGVIGTLPMTPSQLKDMGYVLTNAGLPNVVMSSNGNGDHQYFPKPKTEEITGFPGLREVKGTGGRARWIDEKGKIYEWDRQHGKLEVYDKTGKKHLGEFDPKTGEQTKPGDPGRSIKK